MPIKTQKISVYSLTIGMFVYKLDRPWADSDYPLEGFHIKSADEIRKLKFICRYVFIDESLHLSKEKRKVKVINKEKTEIKIKKVIKVPNQKKYTNVVPLKKVLKKAIKNHQQLHQTVNYLFTHIHNHNIVKINQIKGVLSTTVNNMIENPDALMWIARTRDNDDYTYNFVLKQTIWALATARQIGMNPADMERLALASILSGIGKSKLPKDILLNEQKLDVKQFSIYKQHVNLSVNILKNMTDIHPQIIHIVQNHCEYIDGSGYPNKLQGDDIYLASQIIGLAAFYERSSTPRDLTRAVSPNEALDEINRNKGKKFTAELVEQFVQAIGIYPTGTLVQLNNGEIAVIVESKDEEKQQQRLNPNIIVLRNTMDEKTKKHNLIKLSTSENQLKIVQSLPLGTHNIDVNEINDAVYKYNHSWDLKRIIGF
jgi:HD-GYP domain-containing protein (c-di-GMP phosphodiesterase class II)